MKNILWFKKKTIKHGKTTYSSQDENILLDYISLNPRLPLINSYLFLNNYGGALPFSKKKMKINRAMYFNF
jgi:hypothetical protein